MKIFYICIFSLIAAPLFGQNIVFHDPSSKLPQTIQVQGTIVGISKGYCGVFCTGGVIKVELDKKIEGYTDSFVYLVTACLSMDVKTKTVVNVTATQLTGDETECYYESISNHFDSKGTPFYKLSESETRKINSVK